MELSSGIAKRSLRIPRTVAWLLLILLLSGAFEWQFVKIYFLDLGALQFQFRHDPDKSYPQYPHYLEKISEQVPPNASVALIVPVRKWDDGYVYFFYRASYFLAGRNVIPVVSPDDSLHLEKLARADYAAVWKMELDSREFRPVWSGFGGTLLKRVR